MNRLGLILCITAVAAAALMGVVERCTRPQFITRERVDTLRVPVPVLQLTTGPQPRRLIVRDHAMPETVDSSVIRRLLHERDSLQDVIRSLNAKVVFTLDSITDRGDTIHVECNETDRTIALRAAMAPLQQLHVVRDTIPPPIAPSRPWGLSVGAGMVITSTGTAAPGIFVGLTYSPFTF